MGKVNVRCVVSVGGDRGFCVACDGADDWRLIGPPSGIPDAYKSVEREITALEIGIREAGDKVAFLRSFLRHVASPEPKPEAVIKRKRPRKAREADGGEG